MANKLLQDAKIAASDIIKACDFILNGNTESNACEKYHLDKRKFRNFLRTNYYGCNTITHQDDKAYIEHSLSPAEQIYCKIMNISYTQSSEIIFPKDTDESIEFIMNKWLNEDEITLLKNRYWHGKTLQEIADEQHVTRECIRKKENKIINKISTQENKNILMYGLDIYNKQEQIKECKIEIYRINREKVISDEIESLRQQLYNCRQNNDIEKLRELHDIINTMLSMYENNHNMHLNELPVIKIPILDELTSLRAKNCVQYINTHMKPLQYVSDLMNFTETELLTCRNLGVGVLAEIKNVAEKYDIHIAI